jgi:hypothetical protein
MALKNQHSHQPDKSQHGHNDDRQGKRKNMTGELVLIGAMENLYAITPLTTSTVTMMRRFRQSFCPLGIAPMMDARLAMNVPFQS